MVSSATPVPEPEQVLSALRAAALNLREGEPFPQWRVIATDSESPTGVALVCTADTEWHTIYDHPDGPVRDEGGVYDCCPWPQFDTYSPAMAAYLVALLNADTSAAEGGSR